jgi:hypothetical protein
LSIAYIKNMNKYKTKTNLYEQSLKISKLYLLSILLNTLPALLLFIVLLINILCSNSIYAPYEKEMFLGLYLLIAMFFVSCILNLSFFLLKIYFVKNHKITCYIACYLSSIFYFILFCIYFIVALLLGNLEGVIYSFVLFGMYFCINFVLVFFCRKKILLNNNNNR